jgi:hypothetical protein
MVGNNVIQKATVIHKPYGFSELAVQITAKEMDISITEAEALLKKLDDKIERDAKKKKSNKA